MILVFGNGQLGQDLVRAAAARQVPLVALERAQADISDPAAVRAAIAQHRPALVVNAAAYTKVDLAESEAQTAFRVNADGAGIIGEACAGIPFIHSRTFWCRTTLARPFRSTSRRSVPAGYTPDVLETYHPVPSANPKKREPSSDRLGIWTSRGASPLSDNTRIRRSVGSCTATLEPSGEILALTCAFGKFVVVILRALTLSDVSE